MGNSGIKLKIPLAATGITAPEANLETTLADAVGSSLARGAACDCDWIQRGLSSTAEAAPPT
jgi:hypothetical protein